MQLTNTTQTNSDIQKFAYQPYAAELFAIMAGVLITSASIFTAVAVITATSEPSTRSFSPQPTGVHAFR